jgi:hypothetical protein
MSAKNNKLIKIVVFISCLLIVYSYYIKALNSTNPDAKVFRKWVKSLNLEKNQSANLNDISLQIIMHAESDSKTWNLSFKTSEPENNNKLARLLELADSADLFTKGNKRKDSTISIEIRNKTKSFITNLSTEQVEKDPKLLTFLKLAEIYSVKS